jgi:integrase/recombinase XerD
MALKKYKLTKTDQAIIDEFILRTGGTPASREVIRSVLCLSIGQMKKPIAKIKDLDVLQERDTIIASTYKPSYKRKTIFNLRRFFIWYWQKNNIEGNDLGGITLPKEDWKSKSADDMLTPQDIETILKACHNARDRCLVSMLWDGSNRPVELLLLKWEDLKVDEYGYSFKTSAKTGKERHIRLTMSIPYIEAWKREYPGEPSGKNSVFVSMRRTDGQHKPWTMISVKFMFKTLNRETGIKNFKPGTVRPSRITEDVNNQYPESYLKMKNWGTLKTAMLDKYTNLRPGYIDNIALHQAGMEAPRTASKEEKGIELTVPTCPSCKTLNIPGSMFCAVCRAPLTDAARSQVDKEKDQLTKDILTKVQEMMNRSG